MRCRCSRAFAKHGLVLAVVIGLSSAALLGQGFSPADRAATGRASAVRDVIREGPGDARSMSVLGAAWHSDNTPIPFARVRLRNLVTGQIQSAVTADEDGQFAFEQIERGGYLVELVSEDGRILAVSHTFSVAPGETVATFIRLGTKVPWFNGFFRNAALAVAASAAATGLTAVAPEEVRPVSGRQ